MSNSPLLPPLSEKVTIPHPHDNIQDYSTESLDSLAQLLSRAPDQLPTPAWLHDQESLISTFPPCLLHPKASGLIPRIAASLSTYNLKGSKAHLCASHKPLNSFLIRKIFLELTAECTTRLGRLMYVPADELPVNVREWVSRMQGLNSLWMDESLYRCTYSTASSRIPHRSVPGGCEACILGAVGGDRSILRDLLASVLGRRKKGRVMEGLIDMLEAWIDWTGNGDALRRECLGLGREIGKTRKGLQKKRRVAKEEDKITTRSEESGSRTLVNDESEAEKLESGGDGFENEIIDFYANLMTMSKTTLDTNRIDAHPAEGIHRAFRQSIIYDPEKGTFHRASPTISPGPPSQYSQSGDAQSTRGPLRPIEPRNQGIHKDRIGSCKKLVEISENGEEREKLPDEKLSERPSTRHRNEPGWQNQTNTQLDNPFLRKPAPYQGNAIAVQHKQMDTRYENPRPPPPIRRELKPATAGNRTTQISYFLRESLRKS